MVARISRGQAYQLLPELPQALTSIGFAAAETGLEKSLIYLLEIRASQINGCGFCLDMHCANARASGVDQQLLDVLPAWRELPWFSERECAALEWCELLTRLPDSQVSDAAYVNLDRHFSHVEIVAITAVIVQINSWNRIVAALHFVPQKRNLEPQVSRAQG